jgi:serine protease AprX
VRRRLPAALLASTALVAGGAAALAAPTAKAPLRLAPVEASLLDGGMQRGFVELTATATAADLRAIFATGVVKAHPFRLVPQVAVVAPSSAFPLLAALPGVVRLQEDHGIKLQLHESKSALGVMTARAPKPKGLGLTGKGVRVAVIDTGVDTTHPDLGNVIHAYNTEFAWMTEPVQDGLYGQQAFELSEAYGGVDENGHGTHVASTVGGQGTAARDAGLEPDLTGVAPGVELVSYKIAGASQTGADLGWEQNAMVAIEHIVENEKDLRVKVVSNSWSIYEVDDPDVEPTIQIIRAASRRGLLFAFAASNDGPADQTVGWPGATGEVVTVASTVKQKPFGVSSFSSRGYQVDVAAPGSSITAARSKLASYVPATAMGAAAPFYAAISGTSMATPHVAGVLAMLLEANPRLTPQQLNEVLERTTTDLGDTGKDHSYGWGFVDAVKASKVALCLAKKPGSESCFTAHKAMPKKAWRLDWDDKGNKSRTSQS